MIELLLPEAGTRSGWSRDHFQVVNGILWNCGPVHRGVASDRAAVESLTLLMECGRLTSHILGDRIDCVLSSG